MVNYRQNEDASIDIPMKILYRTLFQYYMAFRLWWHCRNNPRTARRVVRLTRLMQEEADVLLGRLR